MSVREIKVNNSNFYSPSGKGYLNNMPQFKKNSEGN